MPEKITIVKESGESITSNIMSIFMVPESNKQYIITTENAVDPNGLTVLHVSEIRNDKIIKIQTEDEWGTIKTIMRSIISGSSSSFKYLPAFTEINAVDQYKRDISVSAGAAKTLLESYISGNKEVAINDDTSVGVDSNAIASDSIFPTAPVTADADREIAPGIAEVPVTVDDSEDESGEGGTAEPVIPIVDSINNNEVAPELAANDIPVPNSPIPPVEDDDETTDGDASGGVTPVQEVEENAQISAETVGDDGQESGVVQPIGEMSMSSPDVSIPTEESVNIENNVVEGPIPAEESVNIENNMVDVPIPGEAPPIEINNITDPANVGMEEVPVPSSDIPPVVDIPSTEENINTVDNTTPMEAEAPIASEESVGDVNPVPDVSMNSQVVQQPIVQNVTVDTDEIAKAINDMVGEKIEATLAPKVEELIPGVIESSIPKAMESSIAIMQEPIEQQVEATMNKVIEEKIKEPLIRTVEDTVNSTIEKQSKALNSLGIKLDFGVTSSFGKNASLDEIVAGSQELFVEGVKNLIMVMTERVYKELRLKEDELKKREVIVAQREQAINDKTVAMMNGTYDPAKFANSTSAPQPVVSTASVVPEIPTTPSVNETSSAPIIPTAVPAVESTPAASDVVNAEEAPAPVNGGPVDSSVTIPKAAPSDEMPPVADISVPAESPVPETSQSDAGSSVEAPVVDPVSQNDAAVSIPIATSEETSAVSVDDQIPVSIVQPKPEGDTNNVAA